MQSDIRRLLRKLMNVYAATIFISAFLLFLVQPLLAKYILPWFGGSPGVWTTSLLFFQVLLVGGYAYAHWIASRFRPRTQAVLTLLLILVTVALLPITPSGGAPDDVTAPAWHILKILLISVGGCYLLLSATSPLLQSWFHSRWPGASPYRLYALSNIGSLGAVAAYPFLIEPNIGLEFQTKLWSGAYMLFAVLCGACAIGIWKRPDKLKTTTDIPGNQAAAPVPGRAARCMWLVLPMLGSVMLIATTNQMCMDTAVVPLLWLLPMELYLLTFILCFHSSRVYSRPAYGIALVAVLAWMCVILHRGIYTSLEMQIAACCATLFVCCMVCHGELVRLKPDPRHLTAFYLSIAAGGALGGLFVNGIAPLVFKGFWEFHLGLAGTVVVFLVALFRDRKGRFYGGRPSGAWAVFYAGFLLVGATLALDIRDTLRDVVVMKRNFFGVLKVFEDRQPELHAGRRVLMHGRIEHGYQFESDAGGRLPTSYFGPDSGVGLALRFHPKRLDPSVRNLKIGIIGLGTGTLASYGETGDSIRFYEINPDVVEFCRDYFTYLRDSAARTEIVLGDARISMEREKSRREPGRYDILAIDAFTSDAIPLHLLTRECFELYRYHLASGGILAFHVSSRYYNLNPVVRGLAAPYVQQGMRTLFVEDEGNIQLGTDPTRWILITSNDAFYSNEAVLKVVTPWKRGEPPAPAFTDDYANLFKLLH